MDCIDKNSQGLNVNYFHLLTKILKRIGADKELREVAGRKLRIRPKANLNFPVRDVDQVLYDEEQVTVICQFMGLYGVDSPLPQYFNQLCLGESGQQMAVREFLDIFNQRNYAIYYQAWRAFFPEYAIAAGDRGLIECIKSMAGGHVEEKYLPIANSLRQGNQFSLDRVISHYLPGVQIRQHYKVLKWVNIENVSMLSIASNTRLGENSLLGTKLPMANQTIKIELGPISIKELQNILKPNGQLDCLGKFLNQAHWFNINFQFCFILSVASTYTRLGHSQSYLGQHAWLGQWQGGYYRLIYKTGSS